MKFFVTADAVFDAAKELYGTRKGGWVFEVDPIDLPNTAVPLSALTTPLSAFGGLTALDYCHKYGPEYVIATIQRMQSGYPYALTEKDNPACPHNKLEVIERSGYAFCHSCRTEVPLNRAAKVCPACATHCGWTHSEEQGLDCRHMRDEPAQPPGCYYDYDMAEWSCVKGCLVHTRHGKCAHCGKSVQSGEEREP